MSTHAYTIDTRAELESKKLFIGTGTGSGLDDQTFLKDGRGHPFVPGSLLKGVIRNSCEDLLRVLGGNPGDPHDMSKVASSFDPVSQIFGHPHSKDITIHVSDMHFDTGCFEVSTSRVMIDRKLKRVHERSLFSSREARFANVASLTGRIHLWLPDEILDVIRKWELGFLCCGIKAITTIGGAKSSGAGRVLFSITSVTDNGRVLAPGEIDELLFDAASGLPGGKDS
jgi:CRISPR/Cas system CSM-associated protein Csm3 (group 7 of RAMP superfamily)